MRTLSVFIAILACASAFGADGGTKRLLVFGDSICAGSNIGGGSAADAWPALACAKDGLEMVNRSKGGRPTDAVDEFAKALADAGHLDGVLIALGTNDSRDLKADMVDRAVEHIGAMVEVAQRQKVKRIIIVGPPNINPDALVKTHDIGTQRDANLRKLGVAFEAYASTHECLFIPLYGVVPLSTMTRDGVHPDKAGNQAIAKALSGKLAEALTTKPAPGH